MFFKDSDIINEDNNRNRSTSSGNSNEILYHKD